MDQNMYVKQKPESVVAVLFRENELYNELDCSVMRR